MDHGGGTMASAETTATPAAAPGHHAPVQWPLLAAISVATLAVCLAATLLPCGCFRLVSRLAAARRSPDETEAQLRARLRAHERRVAMATGCLTSVGAGVILATCFIGLMPAAASAYTQLCAGATTCLAAASLAPTSGCLAFSLIFWLIRSLVELARNRGGNGADDGETKPLVAGMTSPTDATGGGPATTSATATAAAAAAACCAADAADPSAMQDTTTAVLITAALLLKAVVEGLALPGMLRVASPLFVGLGKCLHEACCGLVLGLAWCETTSGGSGNVSRWGLVALVAYGVATAGSILLGGLTASVHSVAGTAVQFGLLMAASGAGLQAAFVHIVPRLPRGPVSPALVLAGALLMTLVAALHHLAGGGGGHHG